MRTLRVRDGGAGEGQGGEVLSCAYTPDGAFVLSASWDGCLRLWLADNGQPLSYLPAAPKPLSCCALSPDGKGWLSGSMEGVLAWWDAVTHQLKWSLHAHIRPISAIQFSPDGRTLATASWDRKLAIRSADGDGDARMLVGHHDLVGGCRWSPDGGRLLSWSHDGTLRLWDPVAGREVGRFAGHEDRVTAACFSPDGRWVVSGGRDGAVRLWDAHKPAELRSVKLKSEVRACFCLPDGATAVTVNADGWMVMWSLPDFGVQAELASGIKATCAALAPSGSAVALGTEDGRLHVVEVEGVEPPPLPVTPTPAGRTKSGVFGRLLGKPAPAPAYRYTCPACGHTAEVAGFTSQSVPCPACKRLLRINAEATQLQPQ